LRYVNARLDEYDREEAYRIYISKSLQLIPQNQWLSKSYNELLNTNKPVDNRSGKEIAIDVMKKAGLHF
jgi:hypothetical protein